MATVIEGIKFYTIPETAEALNVTPQTIRAYIKNGRIKSQRIGRPILITENNLKEFYEEGEWIVRFLTFNYGREELYEILRSAASGEDFKKSIGRICGINYEAFEDDFKKYALAKD